MAEGAHRSWVFTWNNYPADAYDQLTALRSRFHFMAVGKEVGGNGTPHLQGVLIARNPCRLAALHRLLGQCHFEVMRGSERQAVDYTKKDLINNNEANPLRHDRLDWDDRHQGSRTDIAAAAALVAANPRTALRRVASEMPVTYMKMHAGVKALALALIPLPERIRNVEVFWFWGDTGSGKSFAAEDEALVAAGGDPSNVYRWTIQNLKWAGTYAGQQFVVFEELRPSWAEYSFSRLLVLLDKLQCEVETKGGQVPWCALKVWITTPLQPDAFFTHEEYQVNPSGLGQLLRRITGSRHFVGRWQPPAEAPYVPPHDICPDSADEGQPPPRAPTPPVPGPLPPTQRDPIATDSESDDAFRARLLRRRNAFRVDPVRGLPEDPISDDSDLEVVGFANCQ